MVRDFNTNKFNTLVDAPDDLEDASTINRRGEEHLSKDHMRKVRCSSLVPTIYLGPRVIRS